jgi:hypothetical protein
MLWERIISDQCRIEWFRGGDKFALCGDCEGNLWRVLIGFSDCRSGWWGSRADWILLEFLESSIKPKSFPTELSNNFKSAVFGGETKKISNFNQNTSNFNQNTRSFIWNTSFSQNNSFNGSLEIFIEDWNIWRVYLKPNSLFY